MSTSNIFVIVFVLTIYYTVYAKNIENSTSRNIRTNNTKHNCELVKPFFEMRNITLTTTSHHHRNDHHSDGGGGGGSGGGVGGGSDISGSGVDNIISSTCGGRCCGEKEETALRLQVQQDFATLLRHNSRLLQGLLSTTATTLHDHIMELTSQSENQTLHLFTQVYKRMAVLARDPIKTLYADVKRYMIISEKDVTFAPSNLDIKISVNRFFTELFPLVYHHAINTLQHDFSFDYKSCLRQAFNEIQPFGDIPRQVSVSAFKSLEATRVLLQAFAVGVEILNATDTLLLEDNPSANNNSYNSCHQALLKMTYCPKCRGLVAHTKPCMGYCLNVLRGCLTQHVTELDSPWNDYVEAIERLVIAVKQHDAGVNVDAVIRSLDGKISDAIMYAMENGPDLERRVKLTCGHAKLTEKEDSLIADADTDDKVINEPDYNSPDRIQSSSLRTTPPDTQLLQFLASVVKSRGFYATLADNLCKDDSFAETRDGRECWNGQRIGEYTDTVVDASLGMQKYNPEVRPNYLTTSSSQISRLADKLRHVRQVVVSALGTTGFPESDSYMQGDASEGSADGERKYRDDTDDDNMEGSGGSGDHHPDPEHPKQSTKTKTLSKNELPEQPTVVTAGGSATTTTTATTHLVPIALIIVNFIIKQQYQWRRFG